MTPMYEDEQLELISAMSAMNMHDERKEYTGEFLTDEIPEVAAAHNMLMDAFRMHENGVFNGEYIVKCDDAIQLLKTVVDGEALNVTHSILNHSIEHIEAAMQVYEGKHE